jgi:transcription initiation factor TFIID subunit 15
MHAMVSNADIWRWLDGSEFMGERLVVQFARGSNRPRDDHGYAPRMAPRPRRTVHRMTITGLPYETSWQVSNPSRTPPGHDVLRRHCPLDHSPHFPF